MNILDFGIFKQVADTMDKVLVCERIGVSCYWTGSSTCTYSFSSY